MIFLYLKNLGLRNVAIAQQLTVARLELIVYNEEKGGERMELTYDTFLMTQPQKIWNLFKYSYNSLPSQNLSTLSNLSLIIYTSKKKRNRENLCDYY